MITSKLERAGQVEVPFQSAFFLGDGSLIALPWAEGEVSLAGRQIANRPENSYMWSERSRPFGSLFYLAAGTSEGRKTKRPATGPGVAPTVWRFLEKDRDHQNRDDVDDFDHRIDCRS